MFDATVTVEFPMTAASQEKIAAAKADFEQKELEKPEGSRNEWSLTAFYNRGDLGSVHRELDSRFEEGREKLKNAMKGWKLRKEDTLGLISLANGGTLQYQGYYSK